MQPDRWPNPITTCSAKAFGSFWCRRWQRDQIELAAIAALNQGWQLQCPLPFERSEYRKDSSDPASEAEFDQLIAAADATFEINAKRSGTLVSKTDGWPYETAGLVMLQASDLIIAVWDGRRAEGIGGTGVVVERAVQDEIPVIVIDPAEPSSPRVLWTGFDPLPAANPRLDRMAGAPLDAKGLRTLDRGAACASRHTYGPQ